ncbi:50S ribosomal protein L9 [Buchnera aphidicola (Takecallis arundicolens)]|uniref:50S ribosomal protein L9 n=1 Tax=Buchnera aphidicola TaxID=9 RepID=UPI0034644E72
MKIILLKDMPGLGKFGNTVKVKSGYARNYLVPYGMAVFSNIHNIQELKYHNQEIQLKEKIDIKNAQLRILKIKQISPIIICTKSRKTGQLFGSIGVKDIVHSIVKSGVHIDKNELVIPEGVIRTIGKYFVIFQPYKNVSCYILVKIIPE